MEDWGWGEAAGVFASKPCSYRAASYTELSYDTTW